ncbi:MAG: DNA recombination protein RmuC, partial [Chitinophagaceae bacterium]|nr:DNA recombination protein RmuC [Chitinophagaceae bacterium]
MEFVYLGIGLVLGFVLAWFFAKSKFAKPSGMPLESLEANYIQKTLYEKLQAENKEQSTTIQHLHTRIASFDEKSKYLQEKVDNHKKELEDMQKQMELKFESLSNKIFESKSTKFIELNREKIFDILNPLKEKIETFEKKVDETFKEETRERISLKKELENIVNLNKQVSEDALKLTNALKGDKKMQGDWGEVQLELILNKTGLEKDIHYRKQENFKDEQGNNQRPDYVINLPEEKHVIIDSKVSLVAYEQYFNEEDELNKSLHLKTHVQNLLNHIKGLSSKNYQSLYEINQPDYVLLFVPIEPALYIALKEDSQLFEKALEKNVVLVSTSTLIATLRTISVIWKQDNQRKNVGEIAKESGALYDKFVGFIEDLINLGKKIDGIKGDYTEAMNKL